MLCEECQKKPATIHITRVVNDERSELHLCGECAGQREDLAPPAGWPMNGSMSLPTLLGKLLHGEDGVPRPQPRDTLRCEGCGLTYRQFAHNGLLGCAQCYDAFAARLDPLLRRIHGSHQHGGKAPRGRIQGDYLRRQMDELKRELAEAVAIEEYGRAAGIRDRIKDLEKRTAARG